MTTTRKTAKPLRHHAACTCGWKSASRINPHDAVTLAENHLHNRHPYDERMFADVVSTGGED